MSPKRAGPRTVCLRTQPVVRAALLLSNNVNPKIIRSLLGHSSITQTMDTYSHLMQDIGGVAVGGLDEAFG